ncbi:MAG: hypothetical protein ACHP85_02435 [Burkholderiales bacterium]
MTTLTAAALLALAVQAQVPREPAKDLFLRSAKAPGVEIRFVDYHWHPTLFEAMASGKGDVPEAKRNWVVVRMILDMRPMTLEGKRLPVGNFGIALWPNLDGKGMQVEVRQVDMRDVFPNLNAMGPVPRGETMYKGPVRFETESPVAERLDVKLTEEGGGVVLTVRYGDHRFSLKLTP